MTGLDPGRDDDSRHRLGAPILPRELLKGDRDFDPLEGRVPGGCWGRVPPREPAPGGASRGILEQIGVEAPPI